MNDRPTPEIDAILNGTSVGIQLFMELRDKGRELERQRDELLEALERLVNTPDERSLEDISEDELDAWEKAEAAIANVKGSKQ